MSAVPFATSSGNGDSTLSPAVPGQCVFPEPGLLRWSWRDDLPGDGYKWIEPRFDRNAYVARENDLDGASDLDCVEVHFDKRAMIVCVGGARSRVSLVAKLTGPVLKGRHRNAACLGELSKGEVLGLLSGKETSVLSGVASGVLRHAPEATPFIDPFVARNSRRQQTA